MVKLIQNIFTANDGEQNKDNNITKYMESNKDSLLDLTDNYYENIVEVLTNNSIDIASSNPKPALLPSSSIFQSLPNQSDIYGIEEAESFHYNKSDIAD